MPSRRSARRLTATESHEVVAIVATCVEMAAQSSELAVAAIGLVARPSGAVVPTELGVGAAAR